MMIVIVIGGFISVLLYNALMLIRNSMIYRYRMRALDIVHEKGRNVCNWKGFYERYEEMGSYNSQLFSFTKWRYKDFYPDGFQGE